MPIAEKVLTTVTAAGAAMLALAGALPACGATAASEGEFRYSDGAIRYHAYRTWKWKVPETGLYALVVSGGIPGHLRLCLDGREIGFSQYRWHLDSMRFTRYVEKGSHTVDLYAHPGPWIWDDKMPELFGKKGLRLSWKKCAGRAGAPEVGFWIEDRDDMVLRRGEKLEIAAAATSGAGEFTLAVSNAVTGAAVAERRFKVGAEPVRVALPTGAQGVFAYEVRNGAGEKVDGPWEYVVVDTGELRIENGESRIGNGAKVVDRVECTEGAGGPHDFRDNGTSSIARAPDGTAYRLAGPAGLKRLQYRWVDKRRRDKGFVPVGSWEKGDAHTTSHDWFAYTLKARNPGRAHIVRCTAPNDAKRLVSVYAIDRKTGQYNGWNLQTGIGPASGGTSQFSFFVWPNDPLIDVMAINSDGNHNSKDDRRAAVVSIELLEFPQGAPPPLAEPAGGWQAGRDFGWEGEQVNLGVNERTMPDIFPAGVRVGVTDRTYMDRRWSHLLTAWERFGDVSRWRGDNLVFQPVDTYSMQLYRGEASRLVVPASDVYVQTAKRPHVDPFNRDIFKLMLLEAEKHGVRLVADFMIQRITPEVAAEWAADCGRASETNGLMLSERPDGAPFKSFSGATFLNPSHPVARRRMVEFCRAFGRRYGSSPAFAGIRHRFWRGWPASFEPTFYKESLGFDDWTVAKFAKEESIGLEPAGGDAGRWENRKKAILRDYRRQWNAWRTRQVMSLHEEMLAALREGAPNAKFYVQNSGANGRPDEGVWLPEAGLDGRAFKGHAEFGHLDAQAYIIGPDVEINHLDPKCFAAFNRRGGDAANPPAKDGVYQPFYYPQGLCCNRSYRAAPYHLQPAAEALARNELSLLLAGGQWCLPPFDEGLREFVRVYRAIPPGEYAPLGGARDESAPVAVWSRAEGGALLVWAVNRTDRPRRATLALDSTARIAENLATGETLRGVKSVVVELPPYMPSAWRVKGCGAVVAAEVPPAPGEAEALSRDLDFLLARPKGGTPGQRGKIAAMARACGAGDFDALRRGMADFKENERSWYEAHEWPADWCVVREGVWRNTISSTVGQERSEYQVLDAGKGRARVKRPEWKEDFFEADKGVPISFRLAGSVGGYRRLTVNALFGGGYGPIRVEVDGKVVGRFAAGVASAPRLETRTLDYDFPCPDNKIVFTLVAEGKKGMAINRMQKTIVPPKPIRRLLVRGPFRKRGGAKDVVAMDEAFIDESIGHGGDFSGWREISIPEGEGMFDLAKALGTGGREDVVAYVAAFMESPQRCGTTLTWNSKAFGWIKFNGAMVVPELRETDAKKGAAYLGGVQKGPRNLLLAKVCPLSGGDWRIGFGILDCRGFKWP